jgi:hypothetical protein
MSLGRHRLPRAQSVQRRSHAGGACTGPAREVMDMLTTILVLLLILWLLGMVTSYTVGGFIHILLIIAIAMVLIRIIQGRRPV